MLKRLINSLLPQGIGRQGTLVAFGDAINFASGLFIAMALTRIIPKDDMGTYRQIMYLAPLVISIAELGLGSTIYRYWKDFDEDIRLQYIRMCVVTSFALGLFGGLILCVLALPLPVLYENPTLRPALLVTALYPLASIPLMLIRPTLISQGFSLRATLLETFFSLVSILSILIPLLLGLNLTQALACWSLVSLLRLGFIPVIFGKYLVKGGVWWDAKVFREVWKYLWPLQLARWPIYFTTYLDKVVASILMTTGSFAAYSLGARQIPFLSSVGGSFSNVMIPHLVEDLKAQRYDQICRRWRIAWEKMAILNDLVAVFCIWYAVPVMQLLFSSAYTDAAVPFRVFAAITFLTVYDYTSLARVFGRSDLIMRSTWWGAVVLVIAMTLLTWKFQAFGMALAVLLSTVTTASYLLWSYKKLLSRPLFAYFPMPRLALILGIAFTSVGISGIIAQRVSLENLPFLQLALRLAGLFAISGLLYLVFLTLAGFLNPGPRFRARFLRLPWQKGSS
jgi:O-antigen/teichoic acid export membrane protein